MDCPSDRPPGSLAGSVAVRSWLVRFPLRVGFLVLLCLAGPLRRDAVAGLPTDRVLTSRDPEIKTQFRDAMAAFGAGDLVRAEEVFRRLTDDKDLSDHDEEIVSFMVGKCLYARRLYDSCLAYFDDWSDRHPKSEFSSAALVLDGHSRYLLGEAFGAARSYIDALAEGPDRHRQIALDNLQPLLKERLRPLQLEYLAEDLGSDRWSWQVRLWIADRLASIQRSADALAQYRIVARDAVRTDLAKVAQSRIKELEHERGASLLIGVLCPLSGDYARFGRRMEVAAQLAAEKQDGKVRLLVGDTWGDPLRAAAAADSLANLGCRAVIGPPLTDCIAATVGLARSADIVQILPVTRRGGAQLADMSPRLVSMSVPPERQIGRLLSVAEKDADVRHVAPIVANTPEGHEAGDALARLTRSIGISMLPVQYFEPGETNYEPVLTRLKAAAGDAGRLTTSGGEGRRLAESTVVVGTADALLIWGADADDLVRLVTEARSLGFPDRLLGDPNWAEAASVPVLHDVLGSVLFVSDEVINAARPGWAEFAAKFGDRSTDEADWLAGRVYDAVNWLAEAASAKHPRSLIEELTVSHGLVGVSGTYNFSKDRRALDARVYRFVDGTPVPVERSAGAQ